LYCPQSEAPTAGRSDRGDNGRHCRKSRSPSKSRWSIVPADHQLELERGDSSWVNRRRADSDHCSEAFIGCVVAWQCAPASCRPGTNGAPDGLGSRKPSQRLPLGKPELSIMCMKRPRPYDTVERQRANIEAGEIGNRVAALFDRADASLGTDDDAVGRAPFCETLTKGGRTERRWNLLTESRVALWALIGIAGVMAAAFIVA
jgi:hypothetical protein